MPRLAVRGLDVISFLLGVAASLLASAIWLVFFSRYLPTHARAWLAKAVSSALHYGIDNVYRNEDAAANDILEDAALSKTVKILSIRGFRLTSPERPLSKLLSSENSYDSLEVMVASPSSFGAANRALGFHQSAVTYGDKNLYLHDIIKSINVLVAASRVNRRIDVRLHDQCESFRLMITDRNLYLSFFPKGKSASTSPVYKIRRDCLLYDAFLKHYNWIHDEHSEECIKPIITWENKDVPFSTLISPAQAASHLSDHRWVFVDCRFILGSPSEGYQRYLANHIRGAGYADLERELSSPVKPGISGRHPLPDEAAFVATMSRLGIDSSIQVVAYDESSGAMAAARLWWLLRWAGHESVAVLDGGFAAWQNEGLPTSKGSSTIGSRNFIANFRPELIASRSQVHAMIENDGIIVDSRTADRYRGENETIDPVAGHIPTARSMPYTENLDSDGRLLPKQQLAARFSELSSESTDNVVFYCGSGVTAAHNVLAFAHSYSQFPRLYAGSWSEWINDLSNPIATGP